VWCTSGGGCLGQLHVEVLLLQKQSVHPRYFTSKINNPRVILQKLAPILRNLHGDAIRVFDALLAEFFQYAAEAIVPPLLLLGRLPRVRRAQLHEQCFT
jgi:hypothetical protein